MPTRRRTVRDQCDERNPVAVADAPARNYKQKKIDHATEQDCPDILKRCEAWFNSQLDLDPAQLVFINDT